MADFLPTASLIALDVATFGIVALNTYRLGRIQGRQNEKDNNP